MTIYDHNASVSVFIAFMTCDLESNGHILFPLVDLVGVHIKTTS